MKTRFKLLILVLITFAGCCPKIKTDVEDLYRESVKDAIYPEKSEIYEDLIPVYNGNKKLTWKTFEGEDYLLVVSWKGSDNYYRSYIDSTFYNTGDYEIWVTTSPELQERMKKENSPNKETRLKQLLGLPPDSEYNYFVEFWVKPSDLFRPCPDGEITDNRCETCFPENADSLHIDWINKNRISRYYQDDLYDQYPWTQLGYTYDWNPDNETHVGLSEFVIAKNKNIKVNAIYRTNKYLQN